jgi:phage-related protein
MTTWSVSTLNDTVAQELERLPADMRAKFTRVSELIEKFGPQRVGMPHTRSLGGKLWEIRASGKDGISRGIYVAVKDKQVIVLRVFIKKTQKTPKKELDIAKERAKEAGLI